jgi:hypothetical protein
MPRYLRIAISVTCGIGCLLFVVLWARSYWWSDNVIGPSRGPSRLGVASGNGWITLRYRNGILEPQAFPQWTRQTVSAAEMEQIYKDMEESIQGTGATFSRPTFRFGWKEDWGFQLPCWMPTVLLGILGVVAGRKLPWRFSLRTLLVAMTVAAVGLGAIILAN